MAAFAFGGSIVKSGGSVRRIGLPALDLLGVIRQFMLHPRTFTGPFLAHRVRLPALERTSVSNQLLRGIGDPRLIRDHTEEIVVCG